ncbi:restriction endonuclease subunit S [Leifsonia sp. RAF41]|uniref:restriction endonuclease subunit S n=1 Tax=Leifsonia sp. RAF41 TaxID=3233056 RepID=UPI003F9CEEB5
MIPETKAGDTTEFAESGIPWLGPIPAAWKISKFRHLFRESSEVNGGAPVGEMLSVSGFRGVEPRHYEDENQRRADADLENYRVVRPGQLVINTMWLNYAGLGVSKFLGHVSPAYRAYWINDQIDPRFAHYLLRSSIYVSGYTALLTGIRPNSLQMSRSDLMAFPIVLPPLHIQQSIADVLDRGTAEIDEFIRDQEELIRLLSERRSAIITRAVTRGLDSSVPLKDSGNASIGKIPIDWSVATVRRVFDVLDCKHITAEFVPDGDFPVASIREIGETYVSLDHAKRTSELYFLALTEGGRQPRPFDLILSRNASVGQSSLVPEGLGAFALGQDVSLIRDGLQQKRTTFLRYVMQSKVGIDAFATAAVGSTFKRINVDDIKSIRFALPPLDQLKEVVQFLDAALADIDEAIADGAEAISLMRERRSALISRAVTGKNETRELVRGA